jgi:hypothetical protein
MFCPSCKAEYRPGITRCSECNAALVEHLSLSGPQLGRKQGAITTKNRKMLIWSLVAFAIVFPLTIMVSNHYGKPEYAGPASFGIMVQLLVVMACRDLYSRTWFWITSLIIAVLHVPLVILLAPLLKNTHYPRLAPLAMLDWIAIMLFIQFIENRITLGKSYRL